jgi:hypothetical protein
MSRRGERGSRHNRPLRAQLFGLIGQILRQCFSALELQPERSPTHHKNTAIRRNEHKGTFKSEPRRFTFKNSCSRTNNSHSTSCPAWSTMTPFAAVDLDLAGTGTENDAGNVAAETQDPNLLDDKKHSNENGSKVMLGE